MKLLITGSSGFVGRAFINSFPSFPIVQCDLLKEDIETINFKDVSSVLHLAAIVHQTKNIPEKSYFEINCDLAVKVAKYAKMNGVKHFIFMSTAKVFGESTNGKNAWNEYSECNPEDAYGKSKYKAEKLILGLQNENFKVAIVRSPLVYGAGVKANMYNLVKLVNNFPILPLRTIHNRRSIVYIGNLVALLEHIIQKEASGIFIGGDQEPLSTTELVQLIANASDRKIFLIKASKVLIKIVQKIKPSIIERLFNSLELDTSITNQKLGFVPPFTSEFGISEMVAWYKKQNN